MEKITAEIKKQVEGLSKLAHVARSSQAASELYFPA
jgi:hypothetical protein